MPNRVLTVESASSAELRAAYHAFIADHVGELTADDLITERTDEEIHAAIEHFCGWDLIALYIDDVRTGRTALPHPTG